ncbi:hypothetical protein [Pseudonocardia autotrophica]|nr:hypothetical protein [Pseudonocardia autotrophica]
MHAPRSSIRVGRIEGLIEIRDDRGRHGPTFGRVGDVTGVARAGRSARIP